MFFVFKKEWEERENDDDDHENDEKGDEGREHPRGRKDRGNQVKKTIFEVCYEEQLQATRFFTHCVIIIKEGIYIFTTARERLLFV